MRTTTPWVLLSLNAACSAVVIFSALASVPGAMMPFTSTIAVYFLPPATSAPFQSIAITRKSVMYAKASSLKKMPHSRARRCSLSAAVASLVTSSRSQMPLPDFSSPLVIVESYEVDQAVSFLETQLHQRAAVARAPETAAGGRIVGGAVRRAEQVTLVGIEEYAFLPVEFHRDMRTAVQVGMNLSVLA